MSGISCLCVFRFSQGKFCFTAVLLAETKKKRMGQQKKMHKKDKKSNRRESVRMDEKENKIIQYRLCSTILKLYLMLLYCIVMLTSLYSCHHCCFWTSIDWPQQKPPETCIRENSFFSILENTWNSAVELAIEEPLVKRRWLIILKMIKAMASLGF